MRKGVHSVDLGESLQTHICLQNLASIQPRTSPVKFAASVVGKAERTQCVYESLELCDGDMGRCLRGLAPASGVGGGGKGGEQ